MLNEIVLAGFGGQGILFAGKILAYAGLMDEKEISWLPSYGPEMRGGTANCSVCISDDPIGSPLVVDPDMLIAMNEPSFDKFINNVKAGGIVIVDSSMINKKSDREDIRAFYVPASELADKNGMTGMANIILLGKFIKETGIVSVDTLRAAFEKAIPPKKKNLVDVNMNAVKLGMEQ
ncbi:MAG: 2-oxoacid:acceptor oxidoreductase family protein [Ruminococcus sp.]|nr:2-oxoacid:acceptor oxidoreductase family protein [Ruminococcus sp.]